MKNTIKLWEHGIVPGSDVTLEINQIFQEYKEDTLFEFEEGDYYFSPHEELRHPYNLSNTDASEYKALGLWLRDMKNCTVSGNGARLWFAGQMQPFTIDHCSNLTIEGFIIDWEKPLVAEGVIVDFGENWAKIFIDNQRFPHRYVDSWLEFDVGAGEWYPLRRDFWCIQYDADNQCIRKNTGDVFQPLTIEEEGNDVYKLTTEEAVDAAIGNLFVLRHNRRLHAGIFIEASQDICVENVTVHSCGGLGCLSQFCHNVRFESVNFVPNTRLGRRVVNGRDDGMHITSNSGTVEITKCNFVGLMDDPINVHGCCVAVDEVVDNRTLRCSYRHEQAKGFRYWAKAEDEISFIDRKNMASLHTMKAHIYQLESAESFTLSFSEEIPQNLLELAVEEERIALENLTNTAAFICTKNRFGSCRARGVLVSTPKPVLIEDNYFESSGSAILVAGDSNYWFESGACKDVTIRRNIFTNKCNSSSYEFCEGVISICPIVPEPEADKPFHENINICNNVFDITTSKSIYALSCGHLRIKDNLIFISATDSGPDSGIMDFIACSNVEVNSNEIMFKKCL